MATVKKRGNSYQIIVSCGYDVRGKRIRHCTTWVIPKDMAPTKVQKAFQGDYTRIFEQMCEERREAERIQREMLRRDCVSYVKNISLH
jgi:hypothetical protein